MIGLGLGLDKLKFKASGGAAINPYANKTLVLSLKNLGLGFTDAVTVRRDGGATPTEADFTYTEILDGTLETWVGANNGFITIVKKQTSTSVNLTQPISLNQLKIVDNGSLILEDSKPRLTFDGTNTYMTLDSTIHNDFDNSLFTCSFWVKTNDVNKAQILISDYLGSFLERRLFCYITSSRIYYEIGDNNTNVPIISLATINPNQWYFVILKYDENGDAELYVDNVFQNKRTLVNPPIANNNAIWLGRRNGATSFTFDGYLDKLAFTNGITSRDNDTEIFNQGI